MKEKDKKQKNELSDFLNYSGDKMSGRERNAFERKLQKDPFAAEAAEGFSEITGEEAVKDIAALEKQVEMRTSRRQKIIYYLIAASVAVLMIISSVFVVLHRGKTYLASNETISSVTSPASKPIAQPSVAEEKDINYNTIDYKSAPEAKKEYIIKAKGRVVSSEDKKLVAVADNALAGSVEKAVTDTGGNFIFPISGDTNRTQIDDYTVMVAGNIKEEKAKVMETKPDQSAPAASEKAVSVYRAAKSIKTAEGTTSKADQEQSGYSPPQPLSGKENFDKYITEHIHNPSSLKEGAKAVVIINFTVKLTGVIENIKIIRSPGNEFSDEAIRLIKEGPEWKPACNNGESINGEVRVRIVFK